MGPEQEPAPSEAPQANATGGRPAPRRGRRSGRGRRGGHGRRGPAKHTAEELPPTPAAEVPGEEPEAIFELATGPIEESGAPVEASVEEPPKPVRPSSASLPQARAQEQPLDSGPSIQKAIEEVNGVVDALRVSLDEMEEVLEMLEMFERQQNVDEREIDSLRRALRQMHRPREGGQHQRR